MLLASAQNPGIVVSSIPIYWEVEFPSQTPIDHKLNHLIVKTPCGMNTGSV